MRLARAAVEASSERWLSAIWKWVPPNYYDLTLEDQRQALGAYSMTQMCKSFLVENRSCKKLDCSDRTNSRFYLLVIRHDAVIDNLKLALEIRSLRPPGPGRLGPSQFDFQVVDDTRTVTPFGMKDGTVPVVLAKDVVTEMSKPKFIWMGGGHEHVKLGMALDEFLKGTDAIVADVTGRQGR